MDRFPLPDERAKTLEDGVDVACVGGQIEDRVEIDAAGELAVAADELAEILLLVPRAKRMTLDEPVGLVAGKPGIDECKQEPLAVEEAVARLEVPAHPLLAHDDTVHQ